MRTRYELDGLLRVAVYRTEVYHHKTGSLPCASAFFQQCGLQESFIHTTSSEVHDILVPNYHPPEGYVKCMLSLPKRKRQEGKKDIAYLVHHVIRLSLKYREGKKLSMKQNDQQWNNVRASRGKFVNHQHTLLKEKEKLRRQRKLSLHHLRKWRHIGSEEP
eukprot:1155198-Pelagomonas_calceolata.AAC.1